jgi:glycosyltransferase involved in cell wall biosynthesis
MVAQTLRPQLWILVDDGSTDTTGSIIDQAARGHSWMRAIHRADRGYRKAGGGVIDAFYSGFKSLGGEPWDYIVKLDGDLSFAPTYFADCIHYFHTDNKLGIGGGTICNVMSGGMEPETYGDPPFHVRGATKIYRRPCWEGIGGLYPATGWDTIDEVKANMLGWKTYTFPDLKLTHYRFAGDADGAWKNWVKNGRGSYISGYHPVFMFFKCLSRLTEKPYGVAAAGLCVGFLSGYFRRVPQVDDRELIKYLRQQQVRRLTLRRSLWTRKS